MKLSDILPHFETYLLTEKRTARNTWLSYKQDLAQFDYFIKEKMNNLEVRQMTSDTLKQFIHWLHDQSITARSIARKISSIKSFFLYMHERHQMPIITRDLIVPKIEKKLPHYLSAQDIELLISVSQQDQTPHGKRNQLMLLLLYSAGVRISELIELTCGAVRQDISCITVNGKGGKQRLVPLPDAIMQHILEYQAATLPRLYKQQITAQSYLFPVFYAKKIRPMTRQAFFGILQQWCKLAGIAHAISPHMLRHSFATHMLKNGADLRSLQLLLGHEHISTVQIYTHVETSFLRTIYDRKHPRS